MSNVICPTCGGPATIVFVDTYCKNDCNVKQKLKDDWFYFVTNLSGTPHLNKTFIRKNIRHLLVSKDDIRQVLRAKFDTSNVTFLYIGKCWPRKGCRTAYDKITKGNIAGVLNRLEERGSTYESFEPFDPIFVLRL